ncbi:MAG: hypothetical protein M0R22_11920, partial [Dehalococcoidia bacterium]|nr:hypothetical protein [Dehalococcoidia bacterium]
MTTTPLSKKELARKRAEAASATYAMEAGALSKTGQPMIAAVLEHTERTTKAKHLAMSICTIVPAAKTNEIPDEDDLTYALHLYVPKPKQDAATSTDAGTAPPAGSAAAAPDAAVTADAPTGESATVYAWRPAKTMSFNSAMVAQDELTMSILNGVEAKADTRCLGVSGTSRRLSFTRAEFSEAFRRHLPVEAYMLPNTINDAQGVWLVYDPEFPVSSHLASGPKLDLDKDPVCVSHLLRATPFKPKWYTGKLGEKPSGGQEHVMMGYTGTVDQQSDGTHRFKRLALHGNVTFCECILASTNLWTDMIQRMFMVVNAHMWLECVARWAILLPLLIAGEVELKSQDMPMNSDARAGSSEYTCCMQIGARAVLCDLDGFYKTCLPPVSPGYIDELCLG